MNQDVALDQAIHSAAINSSLPYRSSKTWEQQTASWIYHAAVRHALANVWRALKTPKPSTALADPVFARKFRENLIAQSDSETQGHREHLVVVPEDPSGRMFAALVGISDMARAAIEEIDENTSLDGHHDHYASNRAKWQAVLTAIEVAESAGR